MRNLCAITGLAILAACGGPQDNTEAEGAQPATATEQSTAEPKDEAQSEATAEEAEAAFAGPGGSVAQRQAKAAEEGYAHAGEKLYAENCALCHDQPEDIRAPSFASLKSMSPAQISFSLRSGKMKAQAQGLDRVDLALLVEYLSGGEDGAYVVPETAMCKGDDISFQTTYLSRWGVDAANSRYYNAAQTDLTRANVADLELAWVFGMPGVSEMRSQPVITQDTVFAAAASGHVFALARKTGCVKWHKPLLTPIRTPLTLGALDGKPVLFFGDATTKAYAMDATTGEVIWSKRTGIFVESMSTAGIVQHENVLYVPLSSVDVAAAMNPAHECCKSHGAVAAHDAATGERLWLARMTEDAVPTVKSSVGTQQWGPSGAPVWTTPAIDAKNGRLYIGTGENTSAPATDTSDAIMALDMKTGERLWTYQATRGDTFNMACSPLRKNGPNCPEEAGPDYDFGGAVVMATMSDGREVVVGGQKSGVVHAVDAATGEGIWKTKISTGSALGGVHWGVSVSNGKVFAPSNDPSFPLPGYEPKPGLYVLDLDTGALIWEHKAERGCAVDAFGQLTSPEPWPECSFRFAYSAAPISTDELALIGALDGKVRAFDAETGEVLWVYDTKQEFESVNGVNAHGGAIDNAGVQLAGDMLFAQSGYSLFSQMPGNALVAFRVSGAEAQD